MLKFASKSILYSGVQFNRLQTLSPIASYSMCCHFSSTPVSDMVPNASSQTNVAIFWDLNNKPPKTISLFDAAIRIKKAALTFGVVRYMAAFGDRNWLNSVVVEMRESRKDGKVKPEANFCGVCGRRFYDEERLVNHFKQVHETEQRKRLNQLESARGSRKVKLVGKFSMKMNKYKNAAKDVLNPRIGSTLSDDLRRAGFGVKAISDRRKVAGDELRRGILNVIEMRQVGCVVIVSDDSEFVSLLNEAKLKQLKTVVVGDSQDGELKRTAEASFSWKDIILGKAKKEAVSVVGRWKDRNVLKSLEWSYNPETENTQAGFGVKSISDSRKVAGDEFRRGILNVIEMRQVGCVVIVSDDSEFVSLLNEAKLKQLKTVVVGDSQDGELKRTAEASFSWKDIILGKAKKEAVSVVGRWKDRNVLKSLEWSYNPETENTQ